MQDKVFTLKEPSNNAEINFETPLIKIYDSNSEKVSPITALLHEQQHAVDLFSLYPSPLINSTILNFLLLKALLDVLFNAESYTKNEWKAIIKNYKEAQNQIREDFYITDEEEELTVSKFKLDVLFETSALEKQKLDYASNLIRQYEKDTATSSTKLELAEYMNDLYNSNIQYRRSGALQMTFDDGSMEQKRIQDALYGNMIPLHVNLTYSPPNVESFFEGGAPAHETFPLKPPLEKIISAHLHRVNHTFEKIVDHKDPKSDHLQIVNQAKKNCDKWVNWLNRLQRHLRNELQVNGEDVYWDSALKYAISIPLENIRRAKRLEKIFLDSLHKSGKQKFLGGYRSQLMVDNTLTSQTVPEDLREIFEKKRKKMGINNLIVGVPVIYFKNGELVKSFVASANDHEENGFHSGHWINFFIVNGMAHNLPRLLNQKESFFRCPILEKLDSGKEIAKQCKETAGLSEKEVSCQLIRNFGLGSDTCLFGYVALALAIFPSMLAESES